METTPCKWISDEWWGICCNDKCPCCADLCPVPDRPGVCLYEEREGKEEK